MNPSYFCDMKVILKTIFSLLIISLFFSCETAPRKAKDITEFIPENNSVVFKIEDLQELKSDLNNNGFLLKLKNTKPSIFFSEKNIFKYLHPFSKSILCISENSDITFLTKQANGIINTDSISGISIKKHSHKETPYQEITISEQAIFTTIKDSVFIASSSQQILKNLIEGHTEKGLTFNKIISLKNLQDFTAIVPVNSVLVDQSLEFNFASWAALDIEILPDAITASGVVLAQDSLPQLISVFKGLQPQHNDIAKVVPLNAESVVSFTYDDFELFKENLQNFRGIKNVNNEEGLLFESITEVGKISFSNGNAIVLKSIDLELTKEALDKHNTLKESFKNVEIFDFTNLELFNNQFLTFTKRTTPNQFFILDDFFVFSENKEVSQGIINSYLSNNTLSKTSYYKESASQLSDESSLLIMKLNGDYSEAISSLLKTDLEAISFKKYPLAMLQFSYDRNFAHVNFVCKEASSNKKNTATSIGKVSQIESITLDNKSANKPVFFSNHRTGGKDIVVQDVSNKLYFISASGKILWTKKLKSQILGEIQEVDLLRNGKKQLAFVTQHQFYILDRTGRDISPFPIKFNDDITQPLSVFDYDNNRKYRFLITQGKEVLMIDSKGKTVKGFKFKKTKSDIVFSPQHFRISGKDYIVIAEENGKLNILSRVGKSRITISKTFDFSKTPPTIEAKKIVIITKNNTKNSIGIDGKVSVRKLKVTSYQFTVKGKTKVTLDDNLMRINGVLVELPFGIYTAPKISIVNRKTYISVTETQESKVYVFNKTGTLLPGFPVFGTSTLDFGDANKNKKVNFMVQGGNKEVLLYEIK